MHRRDLLLMSGAMLVEATGSAIGAPTMRVRGASGAPQDKEQARDALHRFMADFTEDVLRQSPEQATYFGLDTGARGALKSKLDDRSQNAAICDGVLCNAHLRRLRGIDRTLLSDSDVTDYDCLVYANELGAEGARFFYGHNTLGAATTETASPYVVSQQGGSYSSVPDFLDSQHEIENKSDIAAYLARLESFAGRLGQETARIRADAAKGVVLPDFLLETTIAQLNALKEKSAGETQLVQSLERRGAAAGLDARFVANAARNATEIVERLVYPAVGRQAEALAALRTVAKPDAGIWKLPDGEAYYAWSLKVGTTTTLSPMQIHRIGVDKVHETTARMDALLRKQGLSRGSVGERMAALSVDSRFLYPNSDAGKKEIIEYLNGLVEQVRARAGHNFNIRVKAPVAVKRVPTEIEAGAASGYEQHGSIDGSRPAAYYLNLRDTHNWPKWLLPTVTFHETIPGHVLQGAYVVERHMLPLARIVIDFNAYAEGWALYAEQMADEIGMYESDPFGELGFLQEQLLRAGRLVVDTGLHSLRWTRERSVNWMLANIGQPRSATVSEVDRYCSLPGQACGYMIGLTEFNRIRDHARQALGKKFDIRAFNDALLTSGSVPLSQLFNVVGRRLSFTP